MSPLRFKPALTASTLLAVSMAFASPALASGSKSSTGSTGSSYSSKARTSVKKAPVVRKPVAVAPKTCKGAAGYQVSFSTNWTADSHSGPIPGNAHFSPMIVASHKRGLSLYDTSSTASTGIKQMAETGATTVLEAEIAALGSKIGDWVKGDRLDVPGQGSVTIEVDGAHPLVTMVSMIAPSPDWFVGVSGLSLCKNGKWKTSQDWTLKAIDAGSDRGTDFNSANAASTPAQTIHWLDKTLNKAKRGSAVFGSLEFTKL